MTAHKRKNTNEIGSQIKMPSSVCTIGRSIKILRIPKCVKRRQYPHLKPANKKTRIHIASRKLNEKTN